jgi:hypothetical protein
MTTDRPTGPPCGNNPNYPLTEGDRAAVEDFRAYLAARAGQTAERLGRYLEAVRCAVAPRGPWGPEHDAAARAAMAIADEETKSVRDELRGAYAGAAALREERDRLRADRAVVLREAAEIIEQVQHQRDDVVNDALGGLDRITEAEHRAVSRAATTLRRAAAEVQQAEPSKPAVAYTGKGRTWCLACPHPVDEDVPLNADETQTWDVCPSCGRHVLDVAEARLTGGEQS